MAGTFSSCLLTKKIIEQIRDTEIVQVNLLLYKYFLKQNYASDVIRNKTYSYYTISLTTHTYKKICCPSSEMNYLPQNMYTIL